MDEEYEYDEGSDIDNWEDEMVFQDHEGDDDYDEALELQSCEGWEEDLDPEGDRGPNYEPDPDLDA